jgi:hypothetical protein
MGDNTLTYQDNREGLRTLPLNPGECGKFCISLWLCIDTLGLRAAERATYVTNMMTRMGREATPARRAPTHTGPCARPPTVNSDIPYTCNYAHRGHTGPHICLAYQW